MPRKPLPIGGHGNINTRETDDGRWVANTRFRDRDGQTRQIERTGDTAKKATKSLNDAIRDRAASNVFTADSRFRDIVPAWLDHVANRRAATTRDGYQRTLDNMVLDRIGDLRLSEMTTPTLDEYFDELHDEGYSANYRNSVRTVIRGPLKFAVRRGLLVADPTQALSPIEGGRKKKVRALNPEERVMLLAKLDELCATNQYFRGSLVPDLVRFMLGTGVRIGEALAVRWRDVNLGDEPVTMDGERIPPRSVSINGNIVFVDQGGLRRHDGKTENAVRQLALPEFLVTLLWVRRDAEAGDDEPVFPSEVMGWKHPNNMRRSWRAARDQIKKEWDLDFTWVTPHVFRKTAATILDDKNLTARQIADQLGHSNPSMTQNVYLGRGNINPAAAAALDAAYANGG